jgi:DNA-binding NtrC family response regulator
MSALLLYAWPQNVRELKSVVERAVIEASGEEPIPLSPYLDRAPRSSRRQPAGAPAKAPIERGAKVGREAGQGAAPEVLTSFKGNVRKASAELAVSRNTIYRWCEEYGIDPARSAGRRVIIAESAGVDFVRGLSDPRPAASPAHRRLHGLHRPFAASGRR